MLLSFHARGAATSERNRRRAQREGVTINGDKLWTDEEISFAITTCRKSLENDRTGRQGYRNEADKIGLV